MAAPLLQRTCLKPSYSLRRQLLLSFGSTAFLTLVIVAAIATICSWKAGEIVKSRSESLLRNQVVRRLVRNSLYASETFTAYMHNLDEAVQLMTEIVQDRIVGYPEPGWEDDTYVPFLDKETGRNKYPLKSPFLRMDWDIERNINMSNIIENLQERGPGLTNFAFFLSSRPSYFMQGVCDPSEIDASAPTFFENCTSANNDYVTGGVIAPTPTSKGLYEKAADIGILLKPLFEAAPDVSSVGVYFYNSGAGSMVQYPGNVAGVAWNAYISEGCEWMRKINPFTRRPFGTYQDIARCHPNGTMVHQREYNAMERSWCREMALNPWRSPLDITELGRPVITLGKGAFDRRTGNFIGCVGFHVATATITDILLKSKIHEVSDVSVVRYSDNTVLADTLNRSTSSLHVTDTSLIAAGDLAELRHAVDSCRNCTREKLIEIMENNFARCSTSLYTAYPVPLPPIEFDPDYQPEYLVITKISNHAYSSTDKVAITIENETLQISLVSFAIAALGMSVIFLILWFVSRSLTQPLLWIKRAAWNIVNHANDSSSNSISLSFSDEPKAIGCCVPATEISELVHQFKAMITGFSGEGSSSMAHSALFEIPNQFTWQSEFQQIYPLPSSISTSVTVRELPDKSLLGESERSVTSSVVPAPAKRNTGLNIRHLSKDSESANDFCDKVSGQKPRAHESSMFWWILLLIVIPLVLSNAAICWCVSARIIDTVDRWIQIASDESLKLELAALRSVAVLKSTQVQISIDVVRNHYVTTRFVGWLVFDGIIRSDAFTQLEEKAAQECRGYYPDEYNRICPFLADFQTAPCACQWQSLSKVACVDVNYTDARTLQETFFYCQARDYDNVTGNRDKASSFGPGVDDSPDATLWWDDVDKVPGAEKGRNASGFETTYDRVRVSSAMSVVEIPIYNYAIRFNNLDRVISINVAFQSDGMVTGYNGCNRDQAFVSTFQSNATNQAFEISPELCPEGKFGLDPRCTVWYSTGLSLYQKTGQALHISAPYLLAGQNLSAVSATSPIVNPRTGTYVGQTFFEFSAFSISQLLTDLIEPVKPIVFVVTPDNETGVDTFVGQSNFDSWESIAIGNILFPFEGQSSLNRVAFETGPLQKLKSGANDPVQLTRVAADGSLENLRLTLVPVKERVLLPLDPSDFSRGVNVSYLIVFWVGIAYREDEIQQPWRNIEVELDADLYRLRTVYLTIIATVSALFIMCACKITVKVTTPMLTLLKVVQTINAGLVDDDIPPLHGGSREVHQVYNSFAKLCKIVRIVNDAYFSGELTHAYSFICDALKLFRKIGDEKAIGIACNNLGNTLHAMCCDARYVDECWTTLPGICMLKTAHAHYDEAIDIAQRELEKASNDEDRADYSQQLADRLFNRGTFLLLVADDECAPLRARELALSDIAKVRKLDCDVRAFWLEHKLLLNRSAEYFYRLIRRTLGLLDLYKDDDVRAIWDASELVDEGDRFLFAAWSEPSAPLFSSVSRVGRLQQLEGLSMLLDLRRGRIIEAARLAMRILVEDESIIECAFMMAATILLKMIRDDEWQHVWTSKTRSSIKTDLRKMLRNCKQTNLDVGKCLVVALEISDRWNDGTLLESVNLNLLKLYDDCCMKDDNMGLVADTIQGDLNVPIGVKAENEGLQRTSLDLATSVTIDLTRPSFPYAIQMLIDSAASTESDSFILLLTDGSFWNVSTHVPFKTQIERMNNDRETKIHVFILGMGIESNAAKQAFKMMCTVTKKSLYIDIDTSNVGTAFDEVSAILRGICIRNVCRQGVIMEKF